MKKMILACSIVLFAAATTHAQEKETAKPELSKEKKAEFKKLKDEHLTASFKDAGLTDDQIKQARIALENSMQQSNQLKTDNTLTEEQKKAKKDAINDEKNSKLKEIMGDKYKAWSDIRKKQKADEEAFMTNAAQ